MTLPSGPGQTDSAHSRSIALASDQATDAAPLRFTAPDRQTFTLTHVEGNLGGSALVVDNNDPNTTDPGARAVRLTEATGALTGAGAGALLVSVMDGTSLVLRPWIFDDVRGKWFRIAADATPTAASPANVNIVPQGAGYLGAKFFLQVITNTGGVTQFWWCFR